MNTKALSATLAAAIATTGLASLAHGQVLYRDEMSSGTGWGVNGTTDTVATFGYDYSAMGIPEAPNSVGGDAATSGLRTQANLTTGTLSTLTAYPLGQNFIGDFTLRFDAWMNFNAGTSSSTEFMGGGIGYNNVATDAASGAQAIATGDGASSGDWRAFKSPPQFYIGAAQMSAGSRDGANAYYSDFFPSVASPAVQGLPSGSVAGSPGFQWVTWEFAAAGDLVTISLEKPDGARLELVSYDATNTADGSAGVNTDGNISLFYADYFTSIDSSGFNFGVFDNVQVAVPEPASVGLLSLAGLALGRRRRN